MHRIELAIRAELEPYPRKRNGKIYWTARGSVPLRTDGGQIVRDRVELSLKGGTRAERKKEVDALNAKYEADAISDLRPIKFATAYRNYASSTGKDALYVDKLIAALGERDCRAINDTIMTTLRKQMFTADAAPSYINRHLFTPVIAVLNMALKEKAPTLTRPKGHKDRSDGMTIRVPEDEWYGKIEPNMSPELRAIMYVLTVHGRRLGDALGRTPLDFDPVARTLAVGRTKNGSPLLINLYPEVATLINAMPGWQTRKWLFRDGPNSPSNVRKDLLIACMKTAGVSLALLDEDDGYAIARAACKAAGIEYFAPHVAGRHAFATRMLRAGYSLQYVKEAGGWKSIEVLSRLYGHLAKSEINEAVHKVAGEKLFNVTPNVQAPYAHQGMLMTPVPTLSPRT